MTFKYLNLDDEYLNDLWEKAILKFELGTMEIKTKRLNSTEGLWFSIISENDVLIISAAKINEPSSKLKNSIRLEKDDFKKIYPYYVQWKNGDILRKSVRKISRKTSYIFALMNYFEER